MLEKMNQINFLYDVYKTLLTSKQRTYIELYYQQDLSLAEIADELNVSRNAVFDNIKRTEKSLLDYEEKLNVYQKSRIRQSLYDKIIGQTTDEQVRELVEQLQGLE